MCHKSLFGARKSKFVSVGKCVKVSLDGQETTTMAECETFVKTFVFLFVLIVQEDSLKGVK